MAKVLVSLDDALLRRIDRMAKSRGLTRSAYLAHLAEHDLERLVGPGATDRARGALGRIDELSTRIPPGDSTSDVRAERDAR
jgi:Ribbon-helix-helix protein, copG family